MLSKQAISEFREIYFKQYDKILTDEEATEKAKGLLNLYKVVFQPPSNQSQEGPKEHGPQRQAES